MIEGCVFCAIVAGEFGTRFLHDDGEIVAFDDIHPIAPGHALIVPREHFADLPALAASAEAPALLGRLLAVAAKIGAPAVAAGGYRVVVNTGPKAGQTVFHVHVHVLSGRHFAWPPG